MAGAEAGTPQVQVVEKIVEVPQVQVVEKIREKLVFVDPGQIMLETVAEIPADYDEESKTFNEVDRRNGWDGWTDWCFEGRKRVWNGSDGLWVRCGAASDQGCKSALFSFSFNPCVSFFSLLLLFGLVGLCSIQPGEFCMAQKPTYLWTANGVSYTMQPKSLVVKGEPVPPTNYMLLEEVGSASESTGRVAILLGSSAQASMEPGDWSSVRINVASMATNPTCDVSDPDSARQTKKAELRDRGLCSTWTWSIDNNNNVGFGGTAETRLQPVECFMPGKEFGAWMDWTAEVFTWLYIITQDVWIVFLLGIAAWPKYGKLVMGQRGDVPEFSDFGFFAMLFTCGVATGLYFFAVTEPLYHYLGPYNSGGSNGGSTNVGYYARSRFTFNGVVPDGNGGEIPVIDTPNHRAQNAMTLTFYHWGLHGWVVYCLIGVLLGFMVFRKGMPMTIKTCFYPLLGTRIYGFCGDFVDTISVVATTMGVCTSLGMGVMQLNAGIQLMNGGQHWFGEGYYNEFNKPEFMDDDSLADYWTSWPAADRPAWFCSAAEIAQLANYLVAGYAACPQGTDCYKCDPDRGGRNWETSARVATVAVENDQQMFLIIMVSVAAVTSVIVGLKNGIKNLAVFCLVLGQFIIFYVWMMDDTWFLTNLFTQSLGDYLAQLPSLGFYCAAVEQSEVTSAYGEYGSWMRWWTIFYWGWWIAWAPFVGVFNARLARGRTVREFIMASMVASVIYNFIFLDILGGAGLKMQMLAEMHGVGTTSCTAADKLYGQYTINGVKTWAEVAQYADPALVSSLGQVTLDESTIYRVNGQSQNICREHSSGKYSTETEYYCTTVTNLACSLKNEGGSYPLFWVVGQYGEMSKFMIVITLIGLGLYFVCSSDSGSMVDDMICANGILEPNLIQRLLWASTECAAACALMNTGKYVGTVDGALIALRAISIVVGIPYTFICIVMTLCLYRALQYELREISWEKGFQFNVMDGGFSLYECGKNTDPDRPRCCNLECGKLNPMGIDGGSGATGKGSAGRLINNIVAFFCPLIPMLKIGGNLDVLATERAKEVAQAAAEKARKTPEEQRQAVEKIRPSCWGKLTAILACVAFYVGWLFVFIDFIDVTEDPMEWGSIEGNVTHPNGNTEYYMSNRHGYYKEWADKIDEGGKVVYNVKKAGEYPRVNANSQSKSIGGVPIGNFSTSNGESLTVAVGDMEAKSRRLATIGWFFILMLFCGNVTFFRQTIRNAYRINGNLFEDYFCSWLWPTCLTAMADEPEMRKQRKLFPYQPQEEPKKSI
jgi:choline-glycine betaine transporter